MTNWRPGEKKFKKGVDNRGDMWYHILTEKERGKKMSYCEQSNCGYYWKEEGEDFPTCHFEGWTAPCEYEDYEGNEDE